MQKLGLHQKLLQKLSPQQIQLMKLLQVPAASMEQRIKEELEINPALEEGDEEDPELDSNEDEINEEEEQEEQDDFEDEKEEDLIDKDEDVDIEDYIDDDDIPYYKTNANNTSPDDEKKETPITVSVSFQDILLSSLGLLPLDNHHYIIAQHLIGSLDDDGYLRRDLNSIVDDLSFSQNIQTTREELEETLKVIQTLDPAGIAARDLRECLLLQLDRKKQEHHPHEIAYRIIHDYFDEFSKKHYEKIQKNLELTDEQLKEAIHDIVALNPRPGGGSAEETRSSQQIIPDFILMVNNDELELSLNSRNEPDLRVSRSFQEMLQAYARDKKSVNKEAITFIKSKIDSARWFIDAIRQRQITLYTTMQAIMEHQKEYFLSGDERQLKPMILKDIAEMVQMDISTVSRVANSKYVETPYGTFLLKYFFSEGLQTDSGEEASSREIKKILEDAIGGEDKRKPLPDEKLAELLNSKGYNIARRTVAKYREQLNIPVARLRKEV